MGVLDAVLITVDLVEEVVSFGLIGVDSVCVSLPVTKVSNKSKIETTFLFVKHVLWYIVFSAYFNFHTR